MRPPLGPRICGHVGNAHTRVKYPNLSPSHQPRGAWTRPRSWSYRCTISLVDGHLRREMIQGLVRVRILHAATIAPVSRVELSHDLAQLGHQVSPGTLYPLLHQMEKRI